MGEASEEQLSYRAQGPTLPSVDRARGVSYELSVDASRELDRLCVERYAIPSIVLMENAAIGLNRHAREMLDGVSDPSVLICCGPGNNGGDGFALARHLHNAMIPVRIVSTHNDAGSSGDARTNRRIIERMGIEIVNARAFLDQGDTRCCSLIVDALFGTGLSREIEGVAGELIEHINRCRHRRQARVLAVDCPSGLDAQRGEPIGDRVIRADRTLTFAGLKTGMSRVEAHEYLGEVHIAPIGAPIELLRELGRSIEARFRD